MSSVRARIPPSSARSNSRTRRRLLFAHRSTMSPGAIANQRRSHAAQIGKHQFATLGHAHRRSSDRSLRRYKTTRSRATRARASGTRSSPGRLRSSRDDPPLARRATTPRMRACGGPNASARLARDHNRRTVDRAQIDALFRCRFAQAGWRRWACSTARWRRLSRMVCSRAALRMPPPGIARQPIRAAASKATQNPRKGPNEKAKKMRSPAVTPRGPKNPRPVADHPVPALRRIQPAQRLPGGAVGLAEARVRSSRKSQIRPERRMRDLIVDQFAFKGKGNAARRNSRQRSLTFTAAFGRE